jgi:hypothetical protein
MSLCKYSDIFGKPNEGIHSYRVFNIAIVDLILTVIIVIILSYMFNLNFISLLIVVLLLGIILHRVFCVKTTVDKLIFGQ